MSTAGPNVVKSGLVLSLDAANPKSYPGSGNTWFDLSGWGNHGTLVNGPTYNRQGYFTFNNASAQYVTGTIAGFATGSTPHTVESWFYITSYNASRTWLFLLGTASSYNLHWIYSGSPGQFGAWSSGQVNPNLSLNTWLNVTTTFDGTNLVGYENGRYIGNNNTATFSFGSNAYNIGLSQLGESYYTGNIATMKVYNRALSSAEVIQNFNANRGRFGV